MLAGVEISSLDLICVRRKNQSRTNSFGVIDTANIVNVDTQILDIQRIYVSIEIYMQPHTHILIFIDEHTLYTDAFLSCQIACLSDLQATVSRMTSAPSEVQVPRICLAYKIGNQFQGPSNRTWTDSDNYDLRH